MHVKVLPRGKGSAPAAVNYLVGERGAEGHRREGVEVLRGNPDMVAAVADSLEFERKYTSVVIAWAPDDRPTGEQIEAVLDEFEKTAWAGLEPDRYAWTAVLHRERSGGVHAHVLAAQCDLETGRSLNIVRKQIEETATREPKRLGESLRGVRSDALRSIERDTAEATGRMRAMLLRAWLRPLMVGLSLFSGSAAGTGRRCTGCGGASKSGARHWRR